MYKSYSPPPTTTRVTRRPAGLRPQVKTRPFSRHTGLLFTQLDVTNSTARKGRHKSKKKANMSVLLSYTATSFIVSTRWKKGVRTCLFLSNTHSPIYRIEGFLKQFLKAFLYDQHSTQKVFSKAFESAALFDFFIKSLFVRLAHVL